jgi:hypothetical protein
MRHDASKLVQIAKPRPERNAVEHALQGRDGRGPVLGNRHGPAAATSAWRTLSATATPLVDPLARGPAPDASYLVAEGRILPGLATSMIEGYCFRASSCAVRFVDRQYLPISPSLQHPWGPNRMLRRAVTVCICRLLMSKLNGPAGPVPPVTPVKRSPGRFT